MRLEYVRLGLTAALAVVLGIALLSSEPQVAEEEAPSGRLLFGATGCGACHRIGDHIPSMEIGPSLIGLSEHASERVPGMSATDYVEHSILQPQAFTVPGFEGSSEAMPAFPLSDLEVAALVEFLLSAA
ncbi:MAG: cytochrome c [Acidimicrobiia bacterium]